MKLQDVTISTHEDGCGCSECRLGCWNFFSVIEEITEYTQKITGEIGRVFFTESAYMSLIQGSHPAWHLSIDQVANSLRETATAADGEVIELGGECEGFGVHAWIINDDSIDDRVTLIGAEIDVEWDWDLLGLNEERGLNHGGEEFIEWAGELTGVRYEVPYFTTDQRSSVVRKEARALKCQLKRKYPGVRFSVRRQRRTRNSGIVVKWSAGPEEPSVREPIYSDPTRTVFVSIHRKIVD